MAYIDAHAVENIGVEDVVRFLGTSRSLVNLRFRQTLDCSVLEAITRRRLKEVTSRLTNTDHPIKHVSLSCGFTNMKHLKWLFKRHFGVSMREFRKRQRTGSADPR